MDSTPKEKAELQIGFRLYDSHRASLLALAEKLGKAHNTVAKECLIERLEGGAVVPSGVPPVEVDGPPVDGSVKEEIQQLLDILEKRHEALTGAIHRLAVKLCSEPTDLSPVLTEIKALAGVIEDLQKSEKPDIGPELAQLTAAVQAFPKTDSQTVLSELENLKETLASLPTPTGILKPVYEALTELQTHLGKFDMAPVTAGLDVLNRNVGRLADRKEVDFSSLATSAQVEELTASVRAVADRSVSEPTWRRWGIPVAIGACLVLSAIAAFRRPAPTDLAPKVAELNSRVDVQDRAIIAFMDRVEQIDKRTARPKELR